MDRRRAWAEAPVIEAARLALLVAAVAGAHHAYLAWPDGSPDREWAGYVGVHALVVVLALSAMPSLRRWRLPQASVYTAWLAIIESLQCVICGILEWGSVQRCDLCEASIGKTPYIVAAALTIAALLVLRGRNRDG